MRWLNEREIQAGGRQKFDLPSADEFEKAARGADGRLFPWGNQFDWSLVSSYRSTGDSAVRQLFFPTDTSPYGVRNLSGSVAEFTRTNEVPPLGSTDDVKDRIEVRVKGGSWYDDLEPYFRVGGYTRERAKAPNERVGFRIVAYPPDTPTKAESTPGKPQAPAEQR